MIKQMEQNEFLSPGSIVLLKNAKRPLMIIGWSVLSKRNGKEYYFDFAGVMMPYGFTDGRIGYFNRDDIQDVLFHGYLDEETIQFAEEIREYAEKHPELNRCTIEEWNEMEQA